MLKTIITVKILAGNTVFHEEDKHGAELKEHAYYSLWTNLLDA